jgi:hypothetical protein
MNIDDRLAEMRRDRLAAGEAEPFVHLLVGTYDGPNPLKQGMWAGFACDPHSSHLRVSLLERTQNPDRATCPDCLAAIHSPTS